MTMNPTLTSHAFSRGKKKNLETTTIYNLFLEYKILYSLFFLCLTALRQHNITYIGYIVNKQMARGKNG